MSTTLELAKQLISQASVTPEDAGCQSILADYLIPDGFKAEIMQFEDVTNLWLRRGNASPLVVFAGHTDVVPTGPEQDWDSPPFTPTIRNGKLYGRGAADMKSSIAAMTVACKSFVASNPNHNGSIAFLITSDEEGPAINGTVKVIEALQQRNEAIDMCIVGEPSSSKTLGDVIKNGRRGSLSASLVIHGVQGHVAYPHLARNPVHEFAPTLSELTSLEWDSGNEFFPPTTFQISNINAGTGANNVIPGSMKIDFNLRFSTEITADEIKTKIVEVLDRHNLDYQLDWHLSGNPFFCEPGKLTQACEQAIQETVNVKAELSTGGGTSDGRFIAPTGAQVIELGPVNESIHKVNECVAVDALDQLTEIYQKVLEKLLK
ncbi:MAG: succinyl-diaminopimelate desuccinylase [Gammaproteobacteria bacterium]